MNIQKFPYHELTEEIVNYITYTLGTENRSFFRNHVAYYFSLIASSMRAAYLTPGNPMSRPVNCYAVSLAPSGFGKGFSTDTLEDQIIHKFRHRFLEETMPGIAEQRIAHRATLKAKSDSLDPDAVYQSLKKEYERCGPYEFMFTKATEASIGQLRKKLLMADAGAINYQVDEIGLNLTKARDAFAMFLELYDGKVKNNLTKSTTDSKREEIIFGKTPANLMLFGVPALLLDDGAKEAEFHSLNETGMARRAIFAYISDEDYIKSQEATTPQAMLERAKKGTMTFTLEHLADRFMDLADPSLMDMQLSTPDETALLMFEYQLFCKDRSNKIKQAQYVERYEMDNRPTKAMKLASAYSFIDGKLSIHIDSLKSAIRLVEDSGDAFSRIMHRDTPAVKLAKFLADTPQELTKVALQSELPFFKKASKTDRDEILSEAVDWGYTNNISIRRRYSGNVEFYHGQRLISNDLSAIRISYGNEVAYNYTSEEVVWDELYKLCETPGIHWINHHLQNGFDAAGHRHDDNVIPGFNTVILDVDDGTTIQQAQKVFKEHKALYYLTKRHTPEQHRFRIILPISYTLELNSEDFKLFMHNLYDWLPFDPDTETGQRSKKWLSNDSHYQYTDGILLDALPFIPRTEKQIEYSQRIIDLEDMGGLERWFIMNTSHGRGNRNNQLLRYALLLVDAGLDSLGVHEKIMQLNSKLPEPISAKRVNNTIMKTAQKKIAKR